MQLSQEMFKQIIVQLKGGRGDGHDKRKRPRVGLRNRVSLTLLKDNVPMAPQWVLVRDLSHDGIGLLHTRKIPANSLFSIRLKAADANDLIVVYRVRHCEVLDEDLFRIGAILVDVKDFNDPEGTNKFILTGAEETPESHGTPANHT